MHVAVLSVVTQHHPVRMQALGRAEAQRVVSVLLLEVLATVAQVLNLPLVKACGPAVASWMRAAHQCPLDIHNTRVGMNSSEFHESIGMVLTDATSGHSKDIDRSARHYLDTHGMAGCFCNHSKDPNATISWTLVTAVDAPRCALVPTIVALLRIKAGDFVMLDYAATEFANYGLY